MLHKNKVVDINLSVVKTLVWKDYDLSNDEGRFIMECECELTFSDGTKVSFILDSCELDDDKYTRGIYEYSNGVYTQIEDWDN